MNELNKWINKTLKEQQVEALNKSKKYMSDHTHSVNSYSEFKQIMTGEKGLVRAFWCGNADCEANIKAETKATTRCLPLNAKEEEGLCV